MQYRKTVFIWPLYLLCIVSLPATDPVSSTGMSLNQDLASVKLGYLSSFYKNDLEKQMTGLYFETMVLALFELSHDKLFYLHQTAQTCYL